MESLPDEINSLTSAEPGPNPEDEPTAAPAPARTARAKTPLRRLIPARDDKAPLYVQAHGAQIGRSGDCLEIRQKDGAVTTCAGASASA